MTRTVLRARLALGGSVWGGLLGVAVGALAGTLFGLVTQDISLGLDGALAGGALGIFCGALFGIAVALEDRNPMADGNEVFIVETINLMAEPRGERGTRQPDPRETGVAANGEVNRQEPVSAPSLPKH